MAPFTDALKNSLVVRRAKLQRDARVSGVRTDFIEQFVTFVSNTLHCDSVQRIKLQIESISFDQQYGKINVNTVTIAFSVIYYRANSVGDYDALANASNFICELKLDGFNELRGHKIDFTDDSVIWKDFQMNYQNVLYTMPELTGIPENPLFLNF